MLVQRGTDIFHQYSSSNNTSLDVVEMTFNTNNLGAPAVSQPTSGDTSVGSNHVDGSIPRRSTVTIDLKALKARKEELKSICPKDKKSLGQWLAEYLLIDLSVSLSDGFRILMQSANIVSLDLLELPKPYVWKRLPWKTGGESLSQNNVQWCNYPEGVPLPPLHVQTTSTKKEPAKNVARSIQSMKMDDLRYIYWAVTDEDYPMHFKVYEGEATGGLIFDDMSCSMFSFLTLKYNRPRTKHRAYLVGSTTPPYSN